MGFLLGDAIPRFLMNYFNIHITESIAQKSLFVGSIIGVAIGLFLSFLVRDRMIVLTIQSNIHIKLSWKY